jgi:N-acyl-D-amino-acid deacylase
MKTLIRHGTIYDGSGSLPFHADILLIDDKIAAIEHNLPTPEDAKVIDATCLAVSPGFINTHSHMELEVLKNPKLPAVIQQGITTEVLGQDGSSVAPLHDAIAVELADNMAPLCGVWNEPYPWRSFADYMATVKATNPAPRMESLVGHGTLRMNVMGSEQRPPTSHELEQMQLLLAKCMEEGARGLSFGLIYPPGSYGNTEELIAMAKIVARYDGLIMVHMRNENNRLLESVDEMLRVMTESGARLQISHFKALGTPNWGKVQRAHEKLLALREKGYDVSFDQYPWTAACTGLKVCVPPWAYAGGETAFQTRLIDGDELPQIRKDTQELVEMRGGGKCIMIASVATAEYAWMAGQYLNDIAAQLKMDEITAVLHILQHEGPAVVAIYFSISEDDVRYLMTSPLHCVCTDGIVGAHPHPRTYASFPRFLGTYVREQQLMNLQTAIKKITSEPARRLRLWDRGLLRVGMAADLVIFDPLVIKDVNSYTEPTLPPIGIHHVIVRGILQ